MVVYYAKRFLAAMVVVFLSLLIGIFFLAKMLGLGIYSVNLFVLPVTIVSCLWIVARPEEIGYLKWLSLTIVSLTIMMVFFKILFGWTI